MKNWLNRCTRSQRIVLTIIVVYIILASLVVSLIYNRTFGFGDQSLFYSFARNIAQGEAIYSDFIHFRTPGSYFIQAAFISLFGDSIAILNMAMKVESIILYGLVFLVAVCLIFWKNSRLLVATVSLSAFTLLFYPAILQLRSGFALLAVAFYIYSSRVNDDKRKKLTYILTGVSTGLSFVFGQDMAILPIVVVGMFELTTAANSKMIKRFIIRASWLFGGFFFGILPLLLYVAATSNIGNFLYYTLYYAFFLQPKGMDVPYPTPSFANGEYYLPIVVYAMFLFLVYITKNKYLKFTGAIILAFASVRMVSVFGRSDILHLLFSIAEILIIIPFGIYLIWTQRRLSMQQILSCLPWFFMYIAFMVLAIKVKSIFVMFIPLIISFMFAYSEELDSIVYKITITNIRDNRSLNRFIPGLVMGLFLASTTLTFYMLKNTVFLERYSDISNSIHKNNDKGVVGGIFTSQDNQLVVEEVQRFILERNPKSIFSYPIQPYFYSMTKKHAARFMSFEPQTTEAEQNRTIEDLKRNRPEVVVFDPLQAEVMSKSLWKINKYVTDNYEIKRIVNCKVQLWLMVPRKNSVQREYPALTVHRQYDVLSTVTILQNPQYGIKNALLVYDKFSYKLPEDSKSLSLQIITNSRLNSQFKSCSKIEIGYKDGSTDIRNICENDGRVDVLINNHKKPLFAAFYGKNQLPVVWNDVYISTDKR